MQEFNLNCGKDERDLILGKLKRMFSSPIESDKSLKTVPTRITFIWSLVISFLLAIEPQLRIKDIIAAL